MEYPIYNVQSTVLPNSLTLLNENKLNNFVVGVQKKSRFQKAKENAEAKKKVEESEAAKVYDSFVASFAEDESTGEKIFYRGELENGKHEVYNPNKRTQKNVKDSELQSIMNEMKVISQICTMYQLFLQYCIQSRNEHPAAAAPNTTIAPVSKKPRRELDELFDEIKNRQESLVDSNSGEVYSGGSEFIEDTTTNLYVGNINTVTTGTILFYTLSHTHIYIHAQKNDCYHCLVLMVP